MGPVVCAHLEITSAGGIKNMAVANADDTWTSTELTLIVKRLAEKKGIQMDSLHITSSRDENQLRTINRVTMPGDVMESFLAAHKSVTVEWGNSNEKQTAITFSEEKEAEDMRAIPDIVIDADEDELAQMIKGYTKRGGDGGGNEDGAAAPHESGGT